jgi:GcrA cell cycle regulator
MGLGETDRSTTLPLLNEAQSLRLCKRLTADDFRPVEFFRRPRTMFKRDERILRCVEADPRHLTLVELEAGDCRFPYGGDLEGKAITFCGRPRRKGSSYCTPHFHLARNPELAVDRTMSVAPLRLVIAI